MVASTNHATPQPASATPMRRSIVSAMIAPSTATVRPRSSFTNTSGTAHAAAASARRAITASSAKASSGRANAISWNWNATAPWIPQLSP